MAVEAPLRRAPSGHDEEPVPANVLRVDPFLGPVSPELALVDPELRERARALLPNVPGIRQARRRDLDQPLVSAGVFPAAGAEREPSQGASSATPVAPRSSAPGETHATRGASAGPAARFIWARERGAVGYRFALYHDERLIFQRDVRTYTLVLPSRWTQPDGPTA